MQAYKQSRHGAKDRDSFRIGHLKKVNHPYEFEVKKSAAAILSTPVWPSLLWLVGQPGRLLLGMFYLKKSKIPVNTSIFANLKLVLPHSITPLKSDNFD